MKLWMRRCQLGLVVLMLPLLAGCATPALWAKKPHQAAVQPAVRLALAHDGHDVLVCYKEQCGKSKNLRPRAYWLFDYQNRSAKHPKPRFADAALCDNLCPVPVLPVGTAAPETGYAAILGEDGRSFRLWRESNEVGRFSLPVYDGAPPATFWRVGLTPLAVATDTAIVAAACMAQGGGGAGF